MILQFADSELASLIRVGESVQLRFAAARVSASGQAAWARGLVLQIEAAQGPDCGEFGSIEDGAVQVQGRRLPRLDLAQTTLAGPLVLELQFRRGGHWLCQAQSLRLVEPGRLSEDLSC